ncbi:hypothetical protein AGRA3207_006170 [Actinomadura graeca]|uniref:Uncharacterized protein n=1 Tax=Actinomadura graeca TaxID=2750812 RepID=A0ABX8R4Y3_9ACTN|nr:hypothetical protein [Actinomadura graeca]QXJ24777.1 hypothetical protein AGRA3207_006170 [Actinomadura graeca]
MRRPVHATRRRRRAAVVAGLAAVAMPWAACVVSWNHAPGDTATYATIALLCLSAVVAVPVIGVLGAATRGTTSLSERGLDERQVAERLRAHTVAHRIMLAVLVVVAAVVLGTGDGREAHIPMAAIADGVVALFLTHLLLPVLVAGWRQPDPPPDDEEDGL